MLNHFLEDIIGHFKILQLRIAPIPICLVFCNFSDLGNSNQSSLPTAAIIKSLYFASRHSPERSITSTSDRSTCKGAKEHTLCNLLNEGRGKFHHSPVIGINIALKHMVNSGLWRRESPSLRKTRPTSKTVKPTPRKR